MKTVNDKLNVIGRSILWIEAEVDRIEAQRKPDRRALRQLRAKLLWEKSTLNQLIQEAHE